MPKGTKTTSNRPEKKIGPYPGGIGVAVWINTIDTEHGPKQVRSVSISPRRYRDSQTGEWKDAAAYRPGDLPALIHALLKAQEFCFENPIDGEANGEEG